MPLLLREVPILQIAQHQRNALMIVTQKKKLVQQIAIQQMGMSIHPLLFVQINLVSLKLVKGHTRV